MKEMNIINPACVHEMFDGEHEFCIPDYQRAYSWEKDTQVKQFIDDIDEMVTYGDSKPYYIGHFLLEYDEQTPEKYYIIDGQQRLTTVVIFMRCVYNELKKREEQSPSTFEDFGVDIENIYKTYISTISGVYKLSTVSSDNPFFERFVYKNQDVKPGEIRSQRYITDAVQTFEKVLACADDQQIKSWYLCLSNATISTHIVKDKFQATQIFAFQNDRGKSLSELEKLKAEIMHKVYTFATNNKLALNAIGYIRQLFTEIFCLTEKLKTREDEVLHYHSYAFYGYDKDMIQNMRRGLKSHQRNEIEFLKDFTAELLQSYNTMLQIESCYNMQSSSVAEVQLLDKYHSTPLLFKLYYYHSGNNDIIEKCASLMEKILFKMEYRYDDFRTNSMITIAHNYSGDKEQLLKDLEHISHRGFKDYWDFDGSCGKYFTDNKFHYKSSIKYVLWKYENHLREQKRERLLSASEYANEFGNKQKETTLDHITPQNPNFTTYSEDFIRDYLNNIGNLSPMGWGNNASKSNLNPADEDVREYYKTTYLSMQEIYETLVQDGVWGEKQIDERRKRIFEFVNKMYDLSIQ